jgi:hypothetical protein
MTPTARAADRQLIIVKGHLCAGSVEASLCGIKTYDPSPIINSRLGARGRRRDHDVAGFRSPGDGQAELTGVYDQAGYRYPHGHHRYRADRKSSAVLSLVSSHLVSQPSGSSVIQDTKPLCDAESTFLAPFFQSPRISRPLHAHSRRSGRPLGNGGPANRPIAYSPPPAGAGAVARNNQGAAA